MDAVAPRGSRRRPSPPSHAARRRRSRDRPAQAASPARRDDLERAAPPRRAPAAVVWLALAATLAGDREAGARLRPLLEPLRPYLIRPAPAVGFGQLPEWHIGRLELLAGDREAAVAELRAAVAQGRRLEIVWPSAWRGSTSPVACTATATPERRAACSPRREAIAERHGVGWVDQLAPPRLAPRSRAASRRLPTPAAERSRPIRALAARGGRRALAAMVRGLDDAALERRFAEPRRQRALLRRMARGFQPAQAGGFGGMIAYELEPFAIEPPPDAPWRWAIEVDSGAGRARLLEPAPLDAAVTIHFGLADWVRVIAGVNNALTAMAGGRCSVEGDVIVAVRLEAMFGAP